MSTHFANESPSSAPLPNSLRAVFMGTPDFVVPVLDALAGDSDVQVVAAYVPPDRPRGRGRTVQVAPVKQRAIELQMPVIQPPTLRNPDAVAELAAFAPDVIVVAAYGRILPPDVLRLPRLGCLNLHPSLLPKHRGPSPVVGTILSGDVVTGVTLMLLDEGMDTGPIIAQSRRDIGPEDDAQSLTTALFDDGARLLLECLPDWAQGRIDPTPQDAGAATYTRKVERADGAARWDATAAELCRQLRAYSPWPGLYTSWDGKELKLLGVDAVSGAGIKDDVEPGKVISADGTGILVGAGDGLLNVRRLQLEGRRPSDAADFLRGYPDFIGARLG